MGRPLNKRFFDPVPSSNGEGVASYTITAPGTYTTTLPTVVVSAPGLPGGVSAVLGAVTMQALSAQVAAGGTGYSVNDVLTVVGGTGTAATFRVATLSGSAVATVELVPGGGGIYTALAATNPRTTTAVPSSGRSGATLTVTYGVLGVAVTSGGSGYVNATDAAIEFTPASTTAATAVLTTTGTNVILATAFVVGGTAALNADIIKQTSTNEYVMATTEGQSVVTLVASDTLTAGQASITATDVNGSTYYVTKLTAHRAVLMQNDMIGSFEYPSGASIAWDFAAPVREVVQVAST